MARVRLPRVPGLEGPGGMARSQILARKHFVHKRGRHESYRRENSAVLREFWPGSNGIPPGPQNPQKYREKLKITL